MTPGSARTKGMSSLRKPAQMVPVPALIHGDWKFGIERLQHMKEPGIDPPPIDNRNFN
jgi:hypothetical protein